MRMMNRVSMIAALLVPLVAGPAAAQNYRWDIGVNGGGSWYRSILDAEETAMPDASERDEVGFASGWLTGAQLGYWFRPNLGLRVNGTYTDRPLENGDVDVIDHVNLWSGSLDLMWRFNEPNREWLGTEFLPYLALGVGSKWVNPAGDDFTCVDDGESWNCHPFTVSDGTTTGGTFALGERNVIMGLVGLGTDLRLSPGFALRMEVNDRIYRPQMYRAEPDLGAGNSVILPDGDTRIGNVVHEVGAQIGLHMLMGLERAPVVSVAPAPPPPPAPPAPPAPAPEPVEEAITVCVADPMADRGIRMQQALYRVEQGDTVVMVDGRRVPLHETVGRVMIARDADWYIRGQPLTLHIGDDQIEYMTYQGARAIEGERLAYLGTVNGYPVYADRDEVADVIDALESVAEAERDRDLGEILAERRDVRDELEDIEFLYVPLEPTGCIFQPVQMVQSVEKGK